MEKNKNPHKFTEVDRKIGIEMRICAKCNMEFHVLRKQEDTICPYCSIGKDK